MNLFKKKQIAHEIKPKLNEDNAIEDFKKLEKLSDADIKANPNTRIGRNFVDFFTFVERLETKGRKGISFFEFWDNKNDYEKKKYILSLIKYNKNTNMTKIQIWYKIFNLYYGSVNIFKPTIAMNVYYKYKPNSVLDMTMGWGGRLVGACALDVPYYTGIDLNKQLIKPYAEMVDTLSKYSTTKITLIFKDALKVDYSKINYDLVLTSPPYYNIEQYSHQPRINKDDWDETFYKPLVIKTWEHLQKGGHYCLNVPIDVYERVLKQILGKADAFIPLVKSKRKSNEEYKEFIYVWYK